MQGQRRAIDSLPEALHFDHGSTSSETGIDQQICWNNVRSSAPNRFSDYVPPSMGITFHGSTSSEGQNLGGWIMDEPDQISNQISNYERKAEHSWASSMRACAAGPTSENHLSEPASDLSLNNVNVNLNSSQIADGPLFMQSSSSNSVSQDLNINAGFEGQGVDDCQIVECPPVFRSGSESLRVATGTSSVNSLRLRTDQYVEDNDGRPGYSLDGRRLSRKRKAFEGNVGQSSGSGSSNYFQHAESIPWHSVPAPRNSGSSSTISSPLENTISVNQLDQVNPRLGLGVGSVSERSSAFSVAGNTDIARRNLRLRINSSPQQDFLPSNGFAAGGVVNMSSPEILTPHTDLMEIRSPAVTNSTNPQVQSLLAHVPAMRRNLQVSRWSRSSSSRAGSTSSSAIAGERDAGHSLESSIRSMTRNTSEHPIFVPTSGMRSSAHNPNNCSSAGGNASVAGNAASSSRSGSTAGINQSSGPNLFPHRNPSRRLSELVRRSLLSSSGPESGSQNSDVSPTRSGTSDSSQELPLPSAGQGHQSSHSRSAMLLDRHLDGVSGIPYSLRTLASGSEGRSRLVSEQIRNVLDLMRRGEGLRFEDVMILDQSVFFGMGDLHDRHRDMRLDVDNMSYEELLALEERIGNVNTGLSEETISGHLKQRKFFVSATTDLQEPEPCCICQEEYNSGDDVGELECGHEFHGGCIKQWLTRKNLCPICKTSAVDNIEKA